MYNSQIAALFKATTEVRKGAPNGNDNAAGPHRPFTRAGGKSGAASGGVARASIGTPQDAGPRGTKNIEAHIQSLGKLAVPGTIYSPRNGAKGMLTVNTNASNTQVFDALKAGGFNAPEGRRDAIDHESLTSVSESVVHPKSKVTASIRRERGSPTTVQFVQNGIEHF